MTITTISFGRPLYAEAELRTGTLTNTIRHASARPRHPTAHLGDDFIAQLVYTGEWNTPKQNAVRRY
jgi:hypothetical protein